MKNYGVTSLGLYRQNLNYFFSDARLFHPLKSYFHHSLDAVLAWGNKPSSLPARALALIKSIPLIRVEDGFIYGLNPAKGKRMSLVVDDLGIYYDARQPSRLEDLISKSLSDQQLVREQQIRNLWLKHSISKYNHAPLWIRPSGEWFEKPFVLLVDQTIGDESITGAMASSKSFQVMLEAAITQIDIPNILIKVHPEVVSGHKQGHFNFHLINSFNKNNRIRVIAEDFNLSSVIKEAVAVYTVSSQAGFEGLMWGKPVHTFGMPFYAGWGLTHDLLNKPTRRSGASLEQLIYAALVSYPRYVDPESNQLCEVEDIIHCLVANVLA